MGTMCLNPGFIVDPLFSAPTSFFSVPESAGNTLPGNTVHALTHLFSSIDSTLISCVKAASDNEFAQRRLRSYQRYANLIKAVSLILTTEIDADDTAIVACDSLDRLARRLSKSDVLTLSAEAVDQAQFCIFTLKRITRQLPAILSKDLPASRAREDRALCAAFNSHMLATYFHLDCLRVAVEMEIGMAPSVISAVTDGMGSCGPAYATLRQALELRSPTSELSLDDAPSWDDEDQSLLDESEYAWLPKSDAA